MELEIRIKRWEKFVYLRENGWTYSDIAKASGLSIPRVWQVVANGKPKPRRKWGNTLWNRFSKKRTGRSHVRDLVRGKDNFTCQDCKEIRTPEFVAEHNNKCEGLRGRIKLFDVHHVSGLCGKKSRGYDSIRDLAVLVTLCHKCHYLRHDFSKRLSGDWKKS